MPLQITKWLCSDSLRKEHRVSHRVPLVAIYLQESSSFPIQVHQSKLLGIWKTNIGKSKVNVIRIEESQYRKRYWVNKWAATTQKILIR